MILPLALTSVGLALLTLCALHLREVRALGTTLRTLVEVLKGSPPDVPPPPSSTSIPAPETWGDRDSTEAPTQVMANPFAPLTAKLPSLPAEVAAGLSRPRSQRAGSSPAAPHPPPVKVARPRSSPPGPLPAVVPPPRPKASGAPAVSAESFDHSAEDEPTHSRS